MWSSSPKCDCIVDSAAHHLYLQYYIYIYILWSAFGCFEFLISMHIRWCFIVMYYTYLVRDDTLYTVLALLAGLSTNCTCHNKYLELYTHFSCLLISFNFFSFLLIVTLSRHWCKAVVSCHKQVFGLSKSRCGFKIFYRNFNIFEEIWQKQNRSFWNVVLEKNA